MIRKSWWLTLPIIVGIILAIRQWPGDRVDGQEQSRMTTRAKVLNIFPHDPNDFCQGLAIEGQTVWEGTGRYGFSQLKQYDLTTGQLERQVALHPSYFGEGIAVLGERVYQLTWKERVCVVYDKQTLKPLGQLGYTGQGWGLASDGKLLYMSDGTSVIQVLDPTNLKPLRKIRVASGRYQQSNLNELEFVGNQLWACIWYEDRIVRIDPLTGKILGYLDCQDLYPIAQRPDREHVLNGIAYDATNKRLFITGKFWPKLYEVTLPADINQQ